MHSQRTGEKTTLEILQEEEECHGPVWKVQTQSMNMNTTHNHSNQEPEQVAALRWRQDQTAATSGDIAKGSAWHESALSLGD